MTFCDEHEGGCGASLTATDYEAGFCTQCRKGITTMEKCYYDNELCEGELWTCETCLERYCQTHWHETELGHNVECVACEREREEALRPV